MGEGELQEGRHERRFRLVNEATSVKAARDAVARQLKATGWPEHSIDMALVVTSELATNAVIHADTPFELIVRVAGSAWIGVIDAAPDSSPEMAEMDHRREGGLGLYLIEAMSSQWGVERRDGHKVVWARIERDHRDPATRSPH